MGQTGLCTPAISMQRWRQAYPKFKVVIGCTVSSKPAWDTKTLSEHVGGGVCFFFFFNGKKGVNQQQAQRWQKIWLRCAV